MNLCSPVNEYEDDINDNDDGGDLETGEGITNHAIVEFARATPKNPQMEYEICVKPNQLIDDRTIIAKIKTLDGQTRNVRSIFTKGKVLGDKLYAKTANRHIIIENYEVGAGTDYDPDKMGELVDAFGESTKMSNLILNNMIYSVLPDILLENRNSSSLVSNSNVQFQAFIDKYNKYIENVSKDIEKKCGKDGVKKTKGNPNKIQQLNDQLMDMREDMIQTIISMYNKDSLNIPVLGNWDFSDCALLASGTNSSSPTMKIGDTKYGNYYFTLLANINTSDNFIWADKYKDLLTSIIDRRLQTESYDLFSIMQEFDAIYKKNIDPSEAKPYEKMHMVFKTQVPSYDDVNSYLKRRVSYFKSSKSAKNSL